jgi:hypothetical protein
VRVSEISDSRDGHYRCSGRRSCLNSPVQPTLSEQPHLFFPSPSTPPSSVVLKPPDGLPSSVSALESSRLRRCLSCDPANRPPSGCPTDHASSRHFISGPSTAPKKHHIFFPSQPEGLRLFSLSSSRLYRTNKHTAPAVNTPRPLSLIHPFAGLLCRVPPA